MIRGYRWRTSQAVTWLATLMSERFGSSVQLVDDDGILKVKCRGAAGEIEFSRDAAAGFGTGRCGLETPAWDGAREGWALPLASPIPAPGGFDPKLPVLERTGGGYLVRYDIPGLAYWMLTRSEEVGRQDLDAHGRFPASAAHAFEHGYLERPIVDEWFTVLGQAIDRLWPHAVSPPDAAPMRVSHDVDSPSRYAFASPMQLVRSLAGDVLKRRSLSGAASGLMIARHSRTSLHASDPSNTFDWLMDQSEKHGMRSAFYFICGRTDPLRDAKYDPEHPAIRSLLRRIHDRGHEVGLHPSYNTYLTPGAVRKEADRLRAICTEEGIHQGEWGGRMHFLRWRTPDTLIEWEHAGMAYDSSLGFADRPGFRCGTCFEYPAFDPVRDRRVDVRIRPLVAMECTVMAPRYLGLGAGEAARERFLVLKDACRKVGGTFTLLWHNTEVERPEPRALYQELLEDRRH